MAKYDSPILSDLVDPSPYGLFDPLHMYSNQTARLKESSEIVSSISEYSDLKGFFIGG